jgi:tRNA A-37 threonylcarbamoyl transferase component Bud32
MPSTYPTLHAHPPDEALRAYAQGQLEPADAVALESHLEACSSCCALVADAPPDSFLTQLQEAHGPVPPPEGETAPPPTELPQVPGYAVLRELGRGGMGVVYEAIHAVMGRRVAVKLLHPELLRHGAAVARFHQEVRAAARLAHPNLVTAFDAGQAGERHFLAMELVQGESLADRLRHDGPLPVAEACAAVRQAAQGLAHAHQSGLVHRDIKPHNLMRTADGTVKVLDFGLAGLGDEPSAEEGPTGPNAVMGTPDYMAPEQAEDAAEADARADVYGLGCTLFHLLTGQAPLPAKTVLLKLLAHRGEAPPSARALRPEVPAALDAVLRRALAKQPAERVGSAAELAEALKPFTDPDARLVVPSRASRGLRTRRLAVGIAVALLLAGAGTAVGIVCLSADRDREMLMTADESTAAHSPKNEGAAPPGAGPAVTAFREIHGAEEKRFVRWAEVQAMDGFRPVSLSVRAGSDQPRFNGIAVCDGRALPLNIRVGMSAAEGETHFFRLRDLHYRQVASCMYNDGGRQKQAHLWVKDGVRFYSHAWRLEMITHTLRVYGTDMKLAPIYLSAELQAKGANTLRVVFAPDDGISWSARHAVSPGELRAQIDDWRAKKWRPIHLNAYADGDQTWFLTAARENRERLDWDCRLDLSEAAYEKALEENDQLGLRPVAVASYCRAGEDLYAAVWERSQAVKQPGSPH